jgi:tRNA (guanine10-N2)-methyltransferase
MGPQLITVKKVTAEVYPRPVFKSNGSDSEKQQTTAHVPAHKDFREKYFQGFRKDGPIGEDGGAVIVQVKP